jgi:zinc transport system substrate-binding protein
MLSPDWIFHRGPLRRLHDYRIISLMAENGFCGLFKRESTRGQSAYPRILRGSRVTFLLFLCVFSACSPRDKIARNETGAPLLAVSIPPQAWFVSRIGEGRAWTLVLAGSGQNPHNYEPSPKQMNDLAGAAAWILSGVEFEVSLRPKIAKLFPRLPIVDGTAGVVFRKIEEHGEDETEHSDLEIDRHTWLGREPAKLLAVHIRNTLSQIDPAGAGRYAANCDALLREIDAEFDALRLELAPLRGRSVFVYHPSFGYFLDEFGISQEAVETGGKEPGPRELARLIKRAKEERAAAIFAQAQFPVNAAKTVAAAVGAELLSLDPLAPDWLANIRRMGEALRKAVPRGEEVP